MAVGCRDQWTCTGHLEEGRDVLYLAEIFVMKL
jgi:hypothetical protein